MRRHWPPLFVFLFCSMLASPSAAQHEGVHWQQDLEAAKTLARQTGRLVLVHFWTENCAPCVTLDQNVFNQPGVAGALEAKFVPVKLNANENSATAQGFGITRVPTDVVITADGQVVGTLISPPTAAAYVAEVTQIVGKHSYKGGTAFANAASAAPMPSQINAAYSNLQLSPDTPAAIGQPGESSQDRFAPPALGAQPSAGTPPANALRVAATPAATNNYQTQTPTISFSQPAVQPVQPAPNQVSNPYLASQSLAPVAPAPTTPAPFSSPAQTIVNGAVPPNAGYGPQLPPSRSAATDAGVPDAGAPDATRLPPGSPPLGFDGYCPVSMRNNWKWVPGDPQWGIVHRGRTYWFASQAEQQQFWTDPDRFSPALSGMDPVMAIDHQQQVPGKREHSIDYDNLFYMFSSEATLQQFTANPERYAVSVRQAMGIPRGRLVR